MPAVKERMLTEGTVTEAAKTNARIATKVNISVELRWNNGLAVLINALVT